jgi:hypothetical protein
MIKFEELEDIIENVQEVDRFIDDLSFLSIEVFDTTFTNNFYRLFDKLLNVYFTEAGLDLIYWWIYEDVDKVLSRKGEEDINVKELLDLYNYMSEHKEVYFNGSI